MTKYLLIILPSIIPLSCNKTTSKEPRTLKFYHYQLWLSNLDTIDLKVSTTFFVEMDKANNIIEYNLKYSESDSLTAFKYSIRADSLFYQDSYCKIIDTINLDYQGETIQLFISDYDEQNLADEESYLFWNLKYGLMGQYNWSMGPVLLFEPSELNGFSKILYEYVVKRERSNATE